MIGANFRGKAGALAICLILTTAACATPEPPSPPVPPAPTPHTPLPSGAPLPPTPQVLPAPQAPPATATCPTTGFDCDFQNRITAVKTYVAHRPGTVGIVLRDRQTGAVWHNEHAEDPTWTASTIKLAMVVDLLRRNREGTITLTPTDHTKITAMLHSSDDDAATTLWTKYGGPDHTLWNKAFPMYGMTTLTPQRGYSQTYPYWGYQKCTTADLDRLMTHVLDKTPAEDKAYIVKNMRTVAANQQWGVWGAGKAATPGNKDGWSEEDGGWVMNTVGFAGPAERYTLAIMNNLTNQGAYDEGRATDTEIARLLFEGRF
ncbi:serine hydrolase [Actinokineospora spheciospongiae]|uniref:tat pathway signal sequence n=1 Tax=Actinokineospora spheciospongiae TaxID=909613 RepID=UPI000D966048|nr:tat pathway signal sequence [Actinokineospora spheciospongiae]PWW58339.1 hypothetical protein DFQ13_109131 [Actinokineospora spheciospongiae]